jgi:hypothetical protein
MAIHRQAILYGCGKLCIVFDKKEAHSGMCPFQGLSGLCQVNGVHSGIGMNMPMIIGRKL